MQLNPELFRRKTEMSNCSEVIDILRNIELGTWFEFIDPHKNISRRGRLVWINPNTSKYIFVNHGGRQIAIESLDTLAQGIVDGNIKIAAIEKPRFFKKW